MNVPGTWNFSELKTADVAGATRFYAAVFGWEVDEVDMGAMHGTMVRLPGYADFLEQFYPGHRVSATPTSARRPASPSALPGSCRSPTAPRRTGTSRSRSPTPMRSLGRARELGGSVLVEPFDVPPVRSAVIADPAGARFTANAFNPG